jgi:voltage-gated potassium channel
MIKRLQYLFWAVFAVVMGGSLGYYLIFKGRYSFIDCLYMTVISITTVGYGEILNVTGNPPAQIFTMLLITFGMGIILYGISALTALIVEGEISGLLRKTKMEKQIGKLSQHYVVCGGGETGRALITELLKSGAQVVVIDADEKNIERIKALEGVLYIQGDATEDQNLVAAGIERAAGVLICLPSDKDNLYITMTARILNKKTRIVSRMITEAIRPKLIKAGADRVVAGSTIGALRMASEMIRPDAVDFLDQMLRSTQGNLRIHQVRVSEGSPRIGTTIESSGIKKQFNLLVLGTRRPDGGMMFNPPSYLTLEAGMILIVMGEMANIANAQEQF